MRKKSKLFQKLEEDSGGRKGYLGGEEAELCVEFVKCEICYEIIGKCDMSKFDTPMTGAMFLSKDPKHGYPPPFHPSLIWEDIRCPICNNRPFLNREKFVNEKGEWCGFSFACICGKGYQSRHALMGHNKSCEEHMSWLKTQ